MPAFLFLIEFGRCCGSVVMPGDVGWYFWGFFSYEQVVVWFYLFFTSEGIQEFEAASKFVFLCSKTWSFFIHQTESVYSTAQHQN